MNKSFVFLFVIVTLVLSPFICGCENNERGTYSNQNNQYDDETYVSVDIRNDYWGYIGIFVGNAQVDQIPPGSNRGISRSLIGNEKFLITILFFDPDGNPIAQSDGYSFDRDYTEYHMNVRAPNDIRVY